VNKLTDFAFGIEWVKNKVFEKAKAQVMKMSGGLYPAPLRVSNENNVQYVQQEYKNRIK
jgi:hypothetical protein